MVHAEPKPRAEMVLRPAAGLTAVNTLHKRGRLGEITACTTARHLVEILAGAIDEAAFAHYASAADATASCARPTASIPL